MQIKEEIVRGVCFSPEKKDKFEHFQKCKQSVKITQYGQNHKYVTRNIFIEKWTKVILSVAHLPFACVDLDSNKAVGLLKRVAPNQTATIKCCLSII